MTADQQAQRELKLYGCTESEIDAEVERYGFDSPRLKVALSILSDAQEEISLAQDGSDRMTVGPEEHAERVRQYINRAKYLIDQEIVLGEKPR